MLADAAPTQEHWVLNARPLAGGRVLYDSFVASKRVVLLSTDFHVDRTKAWLLREHFTRYSELHCYPSDCPVPVAEWKAQKLRSLVSGGTSAFFIDADPQSIGQAVQEGVPSLLAVFPAQFPGRPEVAYTPWYDLVGVIERQNMIRASKAERQHFVIEGELS